MAPELAANCGSVSGRRSFLVAVTTFVLIQDVLLFRGAPVGHCGPYLCWPVCHTLGLESHSCIDTASSGSVPTSGSAQAGLRAHCVTKEELNIRTTVGFLSLCHRRSLVPYDDFRTSSAELDSVFKFLEGKEVKPSALYSPELAADMCAPSV